ncbi:MAG: hypothetical protein LBS01_09390 [Prevotellaceae bacterium]|jgi:hypothetical protein|nr:hypothetical protein [Prevotellaceae bacterium]
MTNFAGNFRDIMRVNKKHQVIEKLFRICSKRNDFEFHNDLVKDVSKKFGFGNPFDVTKLDNKAKLPEILLENDFAIIHVGSGKHKFIKGIDRVFHDFEPIQEKIKWKYKQSLLNQYNTSESNILSVANNQRILHHFLFGQDTEFDDADILKRPKTYFPHRTKTTFEYSFGNTKIELKNIQIEIDLTIEFQGNIGVFEGKNGKPDSFSIYQIYHPFLYYFNANKNTELKGKIKNIFGVYVVREKGKENDTLKLWAYTFENPLDITTIKFIKSAAYKLVNIN